MIVTLKAGGTLLNNRFWHWLILPVYLAITCIYLKNYILSGSGNFQLGLVALMVSAGVNKQRKGSLRFAYAALLLAALYWMIPVSTFMYAALALGIFFFIESFLGGMNIISLLVLFFMSPIFEYASGVFSFPIRLFLTERVAQILAIAGVSARSEGNVILLKGREFSVDPACMGLHMLVISLLAGLILIAVYQKKYVRTINIFWLTAMVCFITGFNVVSNLFRIMCIVYFAVMPATIMHDVIGIVCFIVYIMLPVLFIAKYVVSRHGMALQTSIIDKGGNYKRLLILNAMVILVISAVVIANTYRIPASSSVRNNMTAVAGYSTEQLDDQIIKLSDDNALIYIKPVRGFYSSDHNPMICWKGSGFVFQRVKEEELNGFHIYTAELENGKERLYTSWWYDNGANATIGQLNWRWDAFKGSADYSIVNVTAASREDLLKGITRFRNEKVFNHLMN